MNARFRAACSASSSGAASLGRGKPAPSGAGAASRARVVEVTVDVFFWLWLWLAIVEPLAEPMAEPCHFAAAPRRPDSARSSANRCLLNLSDSRRVCDSPGCPSSRVHGENLGQMALHTCNRQPAIRQMTRSSMGNGPRVQQWQSSLTYAPNSSTLMSAVEPIRSSQ